MLELDKARLESYLTTLFHKEVAVLHVEALGPSEDGDSFQRSGRLEGALETLFLHFWERYLSCARDTELIEVVPPFFAFRGLVMASPVWYPHLEDTVRQKLMRFILAVLDSDAFKPDTVNECCGP